MSFQLMTHQRNWNTSVSCLFRQYFDLDCKRSRGRVKGSNAKPHRLFSAPSLFQPWRHFPLPVVWDGTSSSRSACHYRFCLRSFAPEQLQCVYVHTCLIFLWMAIMLCHLNMYFIWEPTLSSVNKLNNYSNFIVPMCKSNSNLMWCMGYPWSLTSMYNDFHWSLTFIYNQMLDHREKGM